jgi:large subunit ribosomal protein L3
MAALGGALSSRQVFAQFEGMRISSPAGSLRQCRAALPAQQRCQHSRMTVTARQGEVGVGMFGTKAGMTQIFTPDGLALPATVIALEQGNVVAQIKTTETDGYNAVQVGYRVKREDKLTKPEMGHLKKHGAPPMRHLREFKVQDVSAYESGQQLQVSEMFKEGDLIDVAGHSIGKGFQGSIKRWGMARGNMTHGSKSKRQHGSIGMCATPARVFPGLKMAGQMGNTRIKSRKLKVIKVDQERGAIVVHGSVPGKPGNVLEITPAKIVGVNYKYQRNLTTSKSAAKEKLEQIAAETS